MKIIKYEYFSKVRIFWVKYEIFVLFEKIHTLPKNSYFTEIFILYQKIRTLLKYSYFTESFVLYQKICTPDEQVHCFKKPLLLFL